MSKISEYGLVDYINFPLVEISGLPTIQPGELLKFESGITGQVISYSSKSVQAMLFDKKPASVGEKVSRSGQKVSITLDENILGKIIDPLGTELINSDQKRSNKTTQTITKNLEVSPPKLEQRRAIKQNLRTGVAIVDLLLPLARGQREMIAGDRKTGKSSFALKLAKTQVLDGSLVIYASIAKRQDEVKRIKSYFERHNMLDKSILIASFPNNSPSLITLTPFTAMTIAEYFRDLGHDVLVILDDLSNHARSYREIALLNRSFPGRDSYPGDIFYLHAKLLERAGAIENPQKTKEKEVVSITCLPIAETSNNDLTDYITSNLISITDGHILFDNSLFQQGKRPAINPALSVTRVGKQTQTPLQRDMTRQLTTFLTKYEKTKSMTHFAAELGQESQEILRKGSQLWTFFTETSEKNLSPQIQQIFIAMIWHGWLSNVKAKSLIIFRDQLAAHYEQNEKVRKMIDELAVGEKFIEIIESSKAKQQVLIQLCQTSPKQSKKTNS